MTSIRQKINKYLDEKVGKSAHWSEYEQHKMAIMSLVAAYPQDFEYAMKEIVKRMGL